MPYVGLLILWHLNCSALNNTLDKKPIFGPTVLSFSSWLKEDIHSKALNISSSNDWSTRENTYSRESMIPISNSS